VYTLLICLIVSCSVTSASWTRNPGEGQLIRDNKINREDRFFLNRLWKPLIVSQKEQKMKILPNKIVTLYLGPQKWALFSRLFHPAL
jgi:hypothetical protein